MTAGTLEGRVVIITGGAGRIGSVTAGRLAAIVVAIVVEHYGRLDIVDNNAVASHLLPKETHSSAPGTSTSGTRRWPSTSVARCCCASTRDIAAGYGHVGIRCNAVAPGPVVDRRRHDLEPTMRGAGMLSRPCTADDVADVIAFLASDAAAYVTGQVPSVDGGLLARIAA